MPVIGVIGVIGVTGVTGVMAGRLSGAGSPVRLAESGVLALVPWRVRRMLNLDRAPVTPQYPLLLLLPAHNLSSDRMKVILCL